MAPEIAPHQPRTIEEIINPHNLPEAGFQSYTELVNNALDLRKSFITGEFRNPRFEHSHFHDMSALDRGIIALGQAREVATDRESNSVFRGAIDSSLGFRMAEMEYVKLLGQLEFLHHEEGSQEELSEVQEQARQLGHELYGQPQPEIRDAALNELWNILDGKAYITRPPRFCTMSWQMALPGRVKRCRQCFVLKMVKHDSLVLRKMRH